MNKENGGEETRSKNEIRKTKVKRKGSEGKGGKGERRQRKKEMKKVRKMEKGSKRGEGRSR